MVCLSPGLSLCCIYSLSLHFFPQAGKCPFLPPVFSRSFFFDFLSSRIIANGLLIIHTFFPSLPATLPSSSPFFPFLFFSPPPSCFTFSPPFPPPFIFSYSPPLLSSLCILFLLYGLFSLTLFLEDPWTIVNCVCVRTGSPQSHGNRFALARGVYLPVHRVPPGS